MSLHSSDLTASQAVRRLGISRKALLLYERHGLVEPQRSAAGWRLYGPDEMARAAAVVELRNLGLSMAEVKRVIGGELQTMDAALSAHQARLQRQITVVSERLRAVNDLRVGLSRGHMPAAGELDRCLDRRPAISAVFDLPWPWGGERFEFTSDATLIYIVGPLGSGKTRLAEALAANIADAVFVGMSRDVVHDGRRMADDIEVTRRVDQAMRWLADEGARETPALLALVIALESNPETTKVIDMIEHGLDTVTQQAVTAWLKRPGRTVPIFAMTRSSAILDLAAIDPKEAVLFCPANHSPPFVVELRSGAIGFEAIETCLAAPEVRARTAGTIAWRSAAA